MRTTSILSVVSATLTLVVGLAAIGFALLLSALGMSGIGRLDLPGIGPVIGLVVVAAAVYGLVGFGAAAGLTRGATWSLVAAGAVHLIGVISALIALATAGPSGPVLAGLGLTLAGVAAVTALDLAIVPRPRASAG